MAIGLALALSQVRHKTVKRSRGEAERLLRAVLEECQSENGTKIFTQKCKDMSECPSCLKAGELVGDLSWVKPGKYGQSFDDVAFSLAVGQLSDLVGASAPSGCIFHHICICKGHPLNCWFSTLQGLFSYDKPHFATVMYVFLRWTQTRESISSCVRSPLRGFWMWRGSA